MACARRKHGSGDDDFLDVGSAFVNAQRPDFTVERLDRMTDAHAVATVDLYGLDRGRIATGIEAVAVQGAPSDTPTEINITSDSAPGWLPSESQRRDASS